MQISKVKIEQPSNIVWSYVRQVLRSIGGAVGTTIILLLGLTAIFAHQIAPFGPQEGDFMVAKLPPVWREGGNPHHLLGTDQLGQDIFSRIVYGSRVSLTVGLFGVALAATIGVTLGLLAGYFGGWVDLAITAWVNLLLSIPYLVLVIVVAAIFGRSLINVILIFGITDSPIFARLTRGLVLRIKEEDYVVAARSLGARAGRIILFHVLPNILGPLITVMTFEMSAMIFYESGLSFLGLSVPPEVPSWGNMLTLGRRFLNIYPWMAIYPGLAIAITALGVNLLGDRLRDVLDPHIRKK